MLKRKHWQSKSIVPKSNVGKSDVELCSVEMSNVKDDDSSSEHDPQNSHIVNVDFDFFDPNPDIDYLALKRLFTQLFQADAEVLSVHELTDLVLGQPLVGTMVKTDGREGDPVACLSVLNMHVHQENHAMKALREYVLSRASANPELHETLQTLLGVEGLRGTDHVGFVFSERVINIPVQVVPPMYKMLVDEIKWAIDDKEPYVFSHYLILTRTYRLTKEQAEEYGHPETPPPSKRARNQSQNQDRASTNGNISTYSFHPEDEVIQKYASYTLDYSLTKQLARHDDSFGLDVGGRMMLVPAANIPAMIEDMAEVYAVPS